MINLIRTNSSEEDFVHLVKQLDAFLAIHDGDEHAFYDQFNKLDQLNNVVIAYQDSIPVGCGAIKQYDIKTVEVKRMYTLPSKRGLGIASRILKELEQWAVELSYTRCVLETGKRLSEANSLYKNKGYNTTPNYGQYADAEDSICFEKYL